MTVQILSSEKVKPKKLQARGCRESRLDATRVSHNAELSKEGEKEKK
jgi:hypothetical protein